MAMDLTPGAREVYYSTQSVYDHCLKPTVVGKQHYRPPDLLSGKPRILQKPAI